VTTPRAGGNFNRGASFESWDHDHAAENSFPGAISSS
jgi:hypothetical protein